MCCCIMHWLSSHMNNFETVNRLFSQFFGQDLGMRLFDNNIKILFPEKFIIYITSSILKVIHAWVWDQEEIENCKQATNSFQLLTFQWCNQIIVQVANRMQFLPLSFSVYPPVNCDYKSSCLTQRNCIGKRTSRVLALMVTPPYKWWCHVWQIALKNEGDMADDKV